MSLVDVVIETPKGSAQKYDYDQKSHFFELKKILPSGMMFPYDFGFIPDTVGEDGDPLDIIMISEFASFPGCKICCRLLGGFKAEQSEKKGSNKMIRNDRFLVVPDCSEMFSDLKTMDDLPAGIVEELEDFFINYNKIEGKKFRIVQRMQAKDAKKVLEKGKK